MTAKLRFVVMEGPPADYPGKFRSAAERLGLDVAIDPYPHIRPAGFTRAKLTLIRNLLKKREHDELVFFCPGALEHFVEGADFNFHFSAYRSWFDTRRIAVIPHPWTPVSPPENLDCLRWRSKPACTIGFMGSTYGNSRVARTAAKMPRSVRQWILQGRLVRSASRAAWLDQLRIPVRFLPTFARFQTLEAVADAIDPSGVSQLEIVDSGGFDSSDSQKQRFGEHLQRTTYVLCPRGAENFSYRTYEALQHGRVPVIIDNDAVLPPMIPWEKVGLVVSGNRPEQIRARIIQDYREHDTESFLKRQSEAFAVSESLDADEWLARAIAAAIRNLFESGSLRAPA